MRKQEIATQGRRGGRTARARLEAAVRQHQAALDKHRESIHPEDLAFEPLNFADWIRKCDTYPAAAEIQNLIDFIKSGIESNRRSYDICARSARYVDLRVPYLEYAEQAIERRFPAAGASPDPQPYDRGERAYVAYCMGEGGAA